MPCNSSTAAFGVCAGNTKLRFQFGDQRDGSDRLPLS